MNWTYVLYYCFSMKELEKDMAMLRNGMKEVGREVEFFRTQTPLNGDRLVFFIFIIHIRL